MEQFTQQDLYLSGEGGYARYRIPALQKTLSGTILAFCEARKYTGGDSDQIDMFLRRSSDHGVTWGDIHVVATEDEVVCGNPAPVLDRDTGTVWLLFCKNLRDGNETAICEGKAPRTVWVTKSEDDGVSWDPPVEITDQVKPPEWSWYATGPGHGVQLSSGRMVVSCDHIVFKNKDRQDPYYSHIVYSDDHGASWKVGGQTDEGTNESTIVESVDGKLCFNCRNKYRLPDGGNYRAVAWSNDQGDRFSPIVHDAALPEPICEASIMRFSDERTADRNRVLFSNPAARNGIANGRHTMTVRLSYDECRTWPVSRALHEGPAAYSDLCVSDDGHVLCFYERGTEGPYERLTLARFNVEWLTRGADG